VSGERPTGVIPSIVAGFLQGKPSILFLFFALALGAGSILLTPREEDPQIIVPLADVIVRYPGGSAEEVEKLVATPLERLLWQVDGVEYVYSISRRGVAVVTVRFYVGEDRERSLVKLYNRIESHIDEAPANVAGWVVKPIEIDDVPIVSLTLWGEKYDDAALTRMGEELLARLDPVEDISRTALIGGRRREIRVELDTERMKARNVSALEVYGTLHAADASLEAGSLLEANREITVRAGPFLQRKEDVELLVVGVSDGAPIYMRDVAAVIDGPGEPASYTRIGFGPAAARKAPETGAPGFVRPAVTLAFAKKRGTNAVAVADTVIQRARKLRQEILPEDVKLVVTRDYGFTANRKVNELLWSLGFAVATVVALLFLTLGWREAFVVAVAVPVSFSLALAVNFLAGYTINRVTLFALILSLGLVVDDPITNVDNIQRHILGRREKPYPATLRAVKEVLPPVIMSTLAIIVSFTPMFFITGMMGPYMGPMAINVPLTVTFSTVCALSIVPWLAYTLLRRRAEKEAAGRDVTPGWVRRLYRGVVGPLVARRGRGYAFLAAVVVLLLSTGLLVIFKLVPLKMLPFDNKDEIQIVLDLPEGTPLEKTAAACEPFEAYLATEVPEVVDFETYVGTSSPIDFNGLVRHYYFRTEPNLADIRVNLVRKGERSSQSHALALRIRRDLEAIARQVGAKLKIVEVPPGPPVLATIVAEVYGDEATPYEDIVAAARTIEDRFAAEAGVVDADTMAETPRDRLAYELDREKAALHGVTTDGFVRTLGVALEGAAPAVLHGIGERSQRPVKVRLPVADRSSPDRVGRIPLKGADGSLIELAELATITTVPEEQPIYHKNLHRVAFVLADTAGRAPGEAVLSLSGHFARNPLVDREGGPINIEWAGEGEWQITLRVFRDLGLAFGAALLGIYILVVLETNSFVLPVVIMTAIPLTAIGIMPGFWILNAVTAAESGGFADPVFFTATAMIGMIALGGIVVRNSIVLIEFIREAREGDMTVKEAILEAGAVRMRPILLTAATTGLGAWPITMDPIFSGLAWALIFGLLASTAFTLAVVPVVYSLLYGRSEGQAA
jgi:multidrug efflux pump subunit AcrB